MNTTIIIIILIGIFLLWSFLHPKETPQEKGKKAESRIAKLISDEIKEGLQGYVLQNLYIPKVDGGTSEIDVLLICTKGLYVIESKNYAGYIFGNDKQRDWTVSLQKEKHHIYNPIWQNSTHIRHLKRLLNRSVPIHSVIVFSDRGDLKNITYDRNTVRILQTRELKDYLTFIRTMGTNLLSVDTIDSIYQKLLSYQDVSEEKQTDHVVQIKEQKDNPSICPWCGGNLVLRTAKKGTNAGKQFYGCSNYPQCRYIRNIN